MKPKWYCLFFINQKEPQIYHWKHPPHTHPDSTSKDNYNSDSWHWCTSNLWLCTIRHKLKHWSSHWRWTPKIKLYVQTTILFLYGSSLLKSESSAVKTPSHKPEEG